LTEKRAKEVMERSYPGYQLYVSSGFNSDLVEVMDYLISSFCDNNPKRIEKATKVFFVDKFRPIESNEEEEEEWKALAERKNLVVKIEKSGLDREPYKWGLFDENNVFIEDFASKEEAVIFCEKMNHTILPENGAEDGFQPTPD
jgi:hypothetical protein